jgi:hypothetical protein
MPAFEARSIQNIKYITLSSFYFQNIAGSIIKIFQTAGISGIILM